MSIFFNNSSINDWNYGDDNIKKVYHHNSVCYQKISKQAQKIPDGYTEVEYIENTASVQNVQSTSFLSIAFADSVTNNASAYTYTVTFESTEYPKTYNCLLGNSYIKLQPLGGNYNRIGAKFVKYEGDTANGGVVVGKKYEIKIYWNEGESYPKIEVKDITADTTTTTTLNVSKSLTNDSNKIGLFNLYNVNDTGAYTSKAKIYEVKIEDRQGNLVAHGIPCVRTSDNKCGFYNLARDEFEYDESNLLTLVAGLEVQN